MQPIHSDNYKKYDYNEYHYYHQSIQTNNHKQYNNFQSNNHNIYHYHHQNDEKTLFDQRNKIQQQAVTALINASLTHSKFTCNMFCGTGKSHVMMKYLLKCWQINQSKYKRILFLCPSLQILEQLKNIFLFYNDYENDHAAIQCKLFTICGNEQPNEQNKLNEENKINQRIQQNEQSKLNEENKINQRIQQNESNKSVKLNEFTPSIVFCTYQSSHILQHNEFDLAFYDEAHRSTSPKFSLTLSDNFVKIKQRIFFTATIKHYKSCTNEYKDMLNDSLYGPTVFRYTYNKAINHGLIVPFRVHHYNIINELNAMNTINLNAMNNAIHSLKLSKNEHKIDKINTSNNNNNDNNNFNFSTDNTIYNDIQEFIHESVPLILMLIKYLQSRKQAKILTYHNTLKHATYFENILKCIVNSTTIYNNSCNHSTKKLKNMYVVTMSGNMNMKQRHNVFTQFKSNAFACICSNKVLNEGINLNCVDTILFAQQRKSEIDIIQCLGRGVRHYSAANYKKQYCNVIAPMNNYNEYMQQYVFNLIKILINDTYDCSKYTHYMVEKNSASIQINDSNGTVYNDSNSKKTEKIRKKRIKTSLLDLHPNITVSRRDMICLVNHINLLTINIRTIPVATHLPHLFYFPVCSCVNVINIDNTVDHMNISTNNTYKHTPYTFSTPSLLVENVVLFPNNAAIYFDISSNTNEEIIAFRQLLFAIELFFIDKMKYNDVNNQCNSCQPPFISKTSSSPPLLPLFEKHHYHNTNEIPYNRFTSCIKHRQNHKCHLKVKLKNMTANKDIFSVHYVNKFKESTPLLAQNLFEKLCMKRYICTFQITALWFNNSTKQSGITLSVIEMIEHDNHQSHIYEENNSNYGAINSNCSKSVMNNSNYSSTNTNNDKNNAENHQHKEKIIFNNPILFHKFISNKKSNNPIIYTK